MERYKTDQNTIIDKRTGEIIETPNQATKKLNEYEQTNQEQHKKLVKLLKERKRLKTIINELWELQWGEKWQSNT